MKYKLKVNQKLDFCTILEIVGIRRKTCNCVCDCGKLFSRRQDYISKLLTDKKPVSCGCKVRYVNGKQHKLWGGCGDITGTYYSSFRCKAVKNKVPWEITIEQLWELFLNQDKKCAITGVDLVFSYSRKICSSNQTASIDRIDSNKGYTLDNVQWVHKRINLMKNWLPQNEFIEWCNLVSSKQQNKLNG